MGWKRKEEYLVWYKPPLFWILSWLVQISILKNVHNSELDILQTEREACEIGNVKWERTQFSLEKSKSWLDYIQTEFEISDNTFFSPHSSALTQSWLRGGHFVFKWADSCFEYSAVHISVTTAAAAIWNWVISLWSFWLWTHGSHQQENSGI